MKYIILIIMATFGLAGCTKQLKTFDGTPVVYFQYSTEARDYVGGPLVDSTIITFAFAATDKKDSVIMLPIKTTGAPATADRIYTLKVNDSSSAKSPAQYEFVNTDYTIKAGRLSDTVYIKFRRTPEMLATAINLFLELKANDNFAVNIESKITSGVSFVSTVLHRIKVDDILAKPKYWLDTYLGTFSRKKLYLMSQMLSIPIDKLNTSVTIAEIAYYGKFMQRYFNEQKAAGTPIKEEDGTDMAMGPSSQ